MLSSTKNNNYVNESKAKYNIIAIQIPNNIDFTVITISLIPYRYVYKMVNVAVLTFLPIIASREEAASKNRPA